MNENNPDFIGPRLPPVEVLRARIRKIIPPFLSGPDTGGVTEPSPLAMSDPRRPAGCSPAEWLHRYNHLARRPVSADFHRWQAGLYASETDGAVKPASEEEQFATSVCDILITAMLKGQLPRGAGSNTQAVSEAFCLMHKLGDAAPAAMFVAHPKMSGPVAVVPFRSGLHEVRRARGRRL